MSNQCEDRYGSDNVTGGPQYYETPQYYERHKDDSHQDMKEEASSINAVRDIEPSKIHAIAELGLNQALANVDRFGASVTRPFHLPYLGIPWGVCIHAFINEPRFPSTQEALITQS